MESPPWWTVAASVIPPTAVSVWSFLQWWYNRKDKLEERELTSDEKRESELRQERSEVSKSYSALLHDLRNDVDKYRNMINSRNTETYRAWDRARYWHQKAWDMRNEAAYARQIVESARRLSGDPPPVWTMGLDLPPFDDDFESPRASARSENAR